jgi:hypothetical protein
MRASSNEYKKGTSNGNGLSQGLSHRFTEGKAAKRVVVVQVIPRRRIHGTPLVVVPP